MIGNTLLAQARTHSIKADELLAAIVAELSAEAIAARDRVVAEAASAIRLSQIVVAAAVVVGGVADVSGPEFDSGPAAPAGARR